jgi:diguanylate cyclase (GGDEF)-like protein
MLRDSCIHRGAAYRHGGEEFLLLLPNHTTEEIQQFAERLRRRVEEYDFLVHDDAVRITVSIGVAASPNHGASLKEVVEAANVAERLAKNEGKNQVQLAE